MEKESNRPLWPNRAQRLLKLGLIIAAASIIQPDQAIAQNELPPVFIPQPEVKLEKPWTILAKITSYCLQGTTRSETRTRQGILASDPNNIPLGSVIDIEGLGNDYVAEDTGPLVKGWHLDVWSPDCNWSLEWGTRQRNIRVKRWGWG